MRFDIKNDSLAAAPASKTRVEIRDRSNNIHVQEEVNTPAIPAGATVPFIYSTLLPATGTAGNWNVFLVLDDLGAVTEATEFNNSTSSFYFPVTAAGTVPGPCPITAAGGANPRKEGNQFVFELSGACRQCRHGPDFHQPDFLDHTCDSDPDQRSESLQHCPRHRKALLSRQIVPQARWTNQAVPLWNVSEPTASRRSRP